MNSPPGGNGSGPDAMIEVESLSRYYGTVAALRDVSFNAERGEILGFLGPNGAGKTTAMRILTGYLPPTSGTVRVAGHDVVEESLSARKAIGYLPETAPLYTEMTVEGYLRFMTRLRGVDDIDVAVERVMARVSLSDRADQLIGHLSKGFRQRVGIAQALVHRPDVMILDEPTIGLDPRQIREVRELIRELGGDHTVILSTHILPEAQQICDRVLIIHRGRIVAEDTPDELAARVAGGDQIRVAVAATLEPAVVAPVLEAVPGVASAEELGGGVFRVAAEQGANPRPALAAAVVERGWPLEELTTVGVTLEDIFLQLTAEEDQGEIGPEEVEMDVEAESESESEEEES